MSEYEPPHPGWWRASDGNWYPPESHPDRPIPAQPPAPAPPPPPGSGATQAQAAPTGQRPWWRRKWVIAVGAVVVLAVVASVAAGNTDGDSENPETDQQAAAGLSNDDDTDTTEQQETSTAPGSVAVGAEAEADVPALRFDPGPFAFGSLVPVVFDSFGDADGSVWNVRLTSPRDVTADVLDSNSFNDEPPEGLAYAGFDVEMTLASAGKEPLSSGFNFTWEILGGSTAAVYDSSTVGDLFGCGVLDGEFDDFSEVFVGGTLTGTVCIPIPEDDLNDSDTQVAMNFSGDRVTFSSTGSSPPPAQVAASDDSTSAGAERALGVLVPIEFDVFGDADGSVWNVLVSPLRDMTDEVLGANPFNNEPSEGVVFAGFEVEMTLASAGKVPLSTGFNLKWELLGAATASVYDINTMADLFGCGVIDGGFNELAEVFVGGTVSGTVCIPLPAADLADPDTRIAFNFGGDRILFSPDGPAPEPSEIDSGGGPTSVADPRPTGIATQVKWDSFGDADRSVWTTTVTDLRDITAEVLAENPFNDAPPEGVAWIGFDVEMALVESQKEPLSAGFNVSWEVLGGDTRRVYSVGTLSGSLACGVVDNAFDQYGEVFAGGTLSGTICIPVPLADLGHPDTLISLGFDDSRVTFRPS